jgi:hypothetical protein
MPEPLADTDDICSIESVDEAALWQLHERIVRSSTWEHMIYRETEIDQVWRLVEKHPEDVTLDSTSLGRLRASIMAIHDLVGVDHDPQEAARRLEAVLQG